VINLWLTYHRILPHGYFEPHLSLKKVYLPTPYKLFSHKKNYANRSSRISDITVKKIDSPFNNIIDIERYAKKVALKNIHCPNGNI
jgi:hypothetical protein